MKIKTIRIDLEIFSFSRNEYKERDKIYFENEHVKKGIQEIYYIISPSFLNSTLEQT